MKDELEPGAKLTKSKENTYSRRGGKSMAIDPEKEEAEKAEAQARHAAKVKKAVEIVAKRTAALEEAEKGNKRRRKKAAEKEERLEEEKDTSGRKKSKESPNAAEQSYEKEEEMAKLIKDPALQMDEEVAREMGEKIPGFAEAQKKAEEVMKKRGKAKADVRAQANPPPDDEYVRPDYKSEFIDSGEFAGFRPEEYGDASGIAARIYALGSRGALDMDSLRSIEDQLAGVYERGGNDANTDNLLTRVTELKQGLANKHWQAKEQEGRALAAEQKRNREQASIEEQNRQNREINWWESSMEVINRMTKAAAGDVDAIAELARTGRSLDELPALMVEARERIDKIEFRDRYGVLSEVLDQIATNQELADKFLNRIISLPDASPDEHYQIDDLYMRSALTLFDDSIKRINPELSSHFGNVKSLRRFFHDMRLALQQGNMRDFGQLGLTINHEHFHEAVQHVAVSDVNRYFDQAFWAEGLSIHEGIEPEHFEEIEKWVKARMNEDKKYGLLKHEVKDSEGNVIYTRELERYEIDRAITVGRNFFVNKLRAPELISSGDVNMTTEARRWQSYKFESAVRVFNPLRFLFLKFNMMKEQGAIWLTLNLENKLIEMRNKKLFGDKDYGFGGKVNVGNISDAEKRRLRNTLNTLTHIGSVKRNSFEISAPQGRFGYEHGWRVTQAYLNSLPIKISANEFRHVQKQFDKLVAIGEKAKDPEVQIMRHYIGKAMPLFKDYGDQGVDGDYEEYKRDPEHWNGDVYVNAGYLFEVYQRIAENRHDLGIKESKEEYMYGRLGRPQEGKLYPMVQQIDFFLGMLVGNNNDAPLAMKRDLWKKTARLLPGRIVDFLSQNPRLKRIQQESRLSEHQLESVHNRLRLIQNLRISKGEQAIRRNQFLDHMGEDTILHWFYNYDNKNTYLSRGERDEFFRKDFENFTPEEVKYITDVIGLGEDMAIELAAVEWPYMPFLDDAPFYAAKYLVFGDEMSRRRIADFDAGVQSMHAAINIWKDPGQDPKEIIKQFKEMQTQLDAPHGKAAASALLEPWVENYGDFVNLKPIDRKPIIAFLRSLLKEPKSKAQEYYGSEAPALGPKEMNDFTELVAKEGILQRKAVAGAMSMLERVRKKLNARFINYWMYLLSMWLFVGLLQSPYEFSKQLKEAGK